MSLIWDLTYDIIVVLSILGLTITAFIIGLLRLDVVALLILIAIGVTNLLSHEQLFSGFSSEAVISLIAITIISAGLEKSGITSTFAKRLLKLGRNRPTTVRFMLMLSSGCLSGFMRSLGTVALFLPVANKVSLRLNISKSQLLMPISFCTLLGGTMTMVGSGPLILLNTLLSNANQYVSPQVFSQFAPFTLLAVFPVGITLLLAGVTYMSLIGCRLLPEYTEKVYHGTSKEQFMKNYQKGPNLFEVSITPSSLLIGKSLQNLESLLPDNSSVLAIMQDNTLHFPPLRRVLLKEKSRLAILGDNKTMASFLTAHGLHMKKKIENFTEILHSSKSGRCEVVLPPSSTLIGTSVNELHMRRNHRVHVLALRRGNAVYTGEELKKLSLRSGDTLGMFCEWEALMLFSENPDFIVVTSEYPKERVKKNKIPAALGFFLLTIVLTIFSHLSLPIGLLLGAAGMIMTGVLSIDEAYSAVSWKTVFLLAGLVPLGLVMQTTGTTEWLVQKSGILDVALPHWGIQALLMIMATLLALVISNTGSTVILVPVALDLAVSVQADPRIFALTVALGSSMTFLLPTHQSNALVAGPGGYKATDFLKVGTGLTIIAWIVLFTLLTGFARWFLS